MKKAQVFIIAIIGIIMIMTPAYAGTKKKIRNVKKSLPLTWRQEHIKPTPEIDWALVGQYDGNLTIINDLSMKTQKTAGQELASKCSRIASKVDLGSITVFRGSVRQDRVDEFEKWIEINYDDCVFIWQIDSDNDLSVSSMICDMNNASEISMDWYSINSEIDKYWSEVSKYFEKSSNRNNDSDKHNKMRSPVEFLH